MWSFLLWEGKDRCDIFVLGGGKRQGDALVLDARQRLARTVDVPRGQTSVVIVRS